MQKQMLGVIKNYHAFWKETLLGFFVGFFSHYVEDKADMI